MALGIERKKATLDALWRGVEDGRARAYFAYLTEVGMVRRYGADWESVPGRRERLEHEKRVILDTGFYSACIMLADILDFARREKIPYGPGRGSVGGCYVAYALGIHEIDSIEFDLYFERFLNADRVSFPDVDLDFSQRDRDRIIDYIRRTHTRKGQIVLQVGAFARMTARAVVDCMAAAAKSSGDENAYATATNLKKCFPKGSVSGGVKVERELAYWLSGEGSHGDVDGFRQLAEQAGWLTPMLAIDGCGTHLGKHAAGVVIMRQEDLPYMPQTSTDGEHMVTGYDMYALDDLGVLKWDILGLRTLDVLSDADKMSGGDGSTEHLMQIWREHRDDPVVYEALAEDRTLGLFQVDTDGYKRTIQEMQPNCFDHIVQLNALYRPGALDYRREDGKNMVEVFIDRHHGREAASYPHPTLRDALAPTHGVMVYQEQQMRVARDFAGFTLHQADALRKAIGKKRPAEMAKLLPIWERGTADKPEAVRNAVWENIEAAARYSWNKSHAVEYGCITWLTGWFLATQIAAYCASLINSYSDDRDRQAYVVSQARQWADLTPPDINVAQEGFDVDSGKIVFGLGGVKGLGEANRQAILGERLWGNFKSYKDFCRRLPSVPVSMKKALVACGAFDGLEGPDRKTLLAIVTKPGPSGKRITVAEYINHYAKSKNPKPLPADILDYEFPSDADLARGELEAMGYYISNVPLAAISKALGRLPAGYQGGEVSKLRTKDDRNGNEMAFLEVTTPELKALRVLIFASNWDRLRHRVEKGKQLIFRGTMDGDTLKAEACFEADDVRQFKRIKIWDADGSTSTTPLTGGMAQIRALEQEGKRIRLL